MWDSGEYQEGKIRVSTEKGRIRASTENVGSGRVPDNGLGEYWKGGIWVSTGKVGSGRVPKRWDPGQYRKCGIRAGT